MNPGKINNTISDEKYMYILKGRFKSNSLNFYGLFLFIFNTKHGIDISHVLVSTFSSVYDMEPHFGWEKYDEFIINSKWKGNFNPNMTASIEDFFKKATSDLSGQKEILYDYIKNYDYDKIDAFMFDIINKIINDKNLIIETGVQETTETEFIQTKENRSSSKTDNMQDKDNKPANAENGVIINTHLILSPVSGKPIYELKIGDIIMIKIIPNTDRANYYIDFFNLRDDKIIKPVPAKVIDIKSEGKNYPLEILTEIIPGIFGKCIEEERQVKIKIFDPSTDEKITTKNSTDSKKNSTKEFKITEEISHAPESALKIAYVAIGILIIIGLLVLSFFVLIL